MIEYWPFDSVFQYQQDAGQRGTYPYIDELDIWWLYRCASIYAGHLPAPTGWMVRGREGPLWSELASSYPVLAPYYPFPSLTFAWWPSWAWEPYQGTW